MKINLCVICTLKYAHKNGHGDRGAAKERKGREERK
jgi:hypothetical protein